MALPHLRVLDDVSVSILSPSSSHSTQSLALKDSLQADLSTGIYTHLTLALLSQ